MKWPLSLVVLIFGGCQFLAIAPELPSEGRAVVPQAGSIYVYSYSGLDPAGDTIALSETVTISPFGQGFVASRTSDARAGFSTARMDTFAVRSDGDLMFYCGCDAIFPVQTRSTYAITTTGPAMRDGVEYNEVSSNSFTYLGTDTVHVGESKYFCSKIGRLMSVKPMNPTPGISAYSAAITYWYSSKLGYFVAEKSESGDVKSRNYTRLLVSYRLGK